jgi:hypothetical protein
MGAGLSAIRAAAEAEAAVWDLVSGLLKDPERVRAGLDEMIEQERRHAWGPGPRSRLVAREVSRSRAGAAYGAKSQLALTFAEWGSVGLALPLPPPCGYQSTDPP